ncbi:MAG: N-acetylglucosamine kinase [Bacteroidetes bacterium]|nr:N-acetylglucosamine kinase [Bacteroidota bacterium]
MILIADSGSTKTDWRLIDEQKNIHQFQTQGLNPYFLSSELIAEIVQHELISKFPNTVSFSATTLSIYFYGAGCKVEDKKTLVKGALLKLFPSAEVYVESDMLGAARALCGRSPGIAAILGTGSNTCYYDGNKIVENRTSTGFILGDEGSGAHIGKTFIQAFLNDELPEELAIRFQDRFKLNKDEIIDAVYRKPLPNRFLASFSKFVYQNQKEEYILQLLITCFEQFFDKHVCKYSRHKQLQLNCVGSVAFYYSNILRGVADKKGVLIGTIVESPISALTLYHLGE